MKLMMVVVVHSEDRGKNANAQGEEGRKFFEEERKQMELKKNKVP